MIAVDTNILVYAHRRDAGFHDAAAAAVRGLAEGRRSWAIPWPCVHEFLAVVTHPRIYRPQTPLDVALVQIEAWLDSPTLVLIGEGVTYWERLREVLEESAVTGPRTHDGRVATLCAESGVTELWSADRDFSRFPIRVTNPLVA